MHSSNLSLSRRRERGSVLITALIFSAIIAIALTSYIKMTSTALTLANRTYNNTAAMNLADSGLEQAVWSFNQATAGSGTAWSAWTVTGNNATCTLTGLAIPRGATANVKVYVQNYNSSGTPLPLIVAKTTVTPAFGPTMVKMVEVTLKRRSLFATGLVAKDAISFTGNTSVDSWNSDPDKNPLTPAIPYAAGVAHDHGSVGSVSVTSDVSVQNADIYGYASVGGPSTTAITVGAQGRVGPYGTAAGVMDPSRVSSDFTASLDDVTAPTTFSYTLGAIGGSGITLPRGGDSAAADGKFYYSTPSISLTGNSGNQISVTGNVVLTVTNPTGTVVNFGGSASITLATGASMSMYAAGDVDLGGNGVVNGSTSAATMNQPINFQLWGTRPTTTGGTPQNITIHGNGAFSGIIYAPFSALSLDGGGNSGGLWGSAVAKSITVVGNQAFHYDESLANFGANNPFGITKWRELTTQSDRATYATQLNF